MKLTNFFILFAISLLGLNNIFAQVKVGPWQMHRGIGDKIINFTSTIYGDQKAYSQKNIPSSDDVGWTEAPVDANGKVSVSERSKLTQCKGQLDFTYFQTNVFIPANTNVSDFRVSYDNADDGARIYFFNSKHPTGHFNEASDLIYQYRNERKPENANLKDEVAVGEMNRVVIVQFDNCPTGNNVQGINILVNGEEVKVEEEPIDEAPAGGDSKMVCQWTFEGNQPLANKKGSCGNLELKGGATIENGSLRCRNNQWARCGGYTGSALKNKTLVSWVRLYSLDVRSGSCLTIDKTNTDEFDGIVYGEWNKGQWIAGSSYFKRSKKPGTDFRETKTGELVQMAISYEDVNGQCRVRCYRNGKLIYEYTQGTCATYKDNVEFLFGTRHTIGNTPRNFLDCSIEEARVYSSALSAKEISELSIGIEDAVVGFEHFDYRGKSQNFSLGYNAGYFAMGNDIMSSMKVKPGYKVTIYEHDPSRGKTLVLYGDAPNFGQLNFNDVASNLKVERVGNTLSAGQTLNTGDKLFSADGSHYLIMQTDGNLCIYTSSDRFVWCSMAHGFQNARCDMQTDGNLVVYDGSGEARWNSETHPYFNDKFRNTANKPVKLVLENNGSLNLYNAAGQSMWTNR